MCEWEREEVNSIRWVCLAKAENMGYTLYKVNSIHGTYAKAMNRSEITRWRKREKPIRDHFLFKFYLLTAHCNVIQLCRYECAHPFYYFHYGDANDNNIIPTRARALLFSLLLFYHSFAHSFVFRYTQHTYWANENLFRKWINSRRKFPYWQMKLRVW